MKQPTWDYCYLLAVSCLLCLGGPQIAHAQDELSNETYGFADKVPELPSGGGTQALAAAIRAHFRFPADAPRAQQVGSFAVQATVTVRGRVARAWVYGTTKDRIKPSLQTAAVTAVNQLPLLTPAILHDEHVQYEFTVKVKLTGQPDSPQVEVEAPTSGPIDLSGLTGNSSQPVEEYNPDRVYTYVEQMPALPGGSDNRVISEAIVQRLVLPADLPEGVVFVRFVVDREGRVISPQLVRGSSPRVDAVVLAAVKRLPHFTPGRQNSRPVNVEFNVRVPVVQPRKPALPGK